MEKRKSLFISALLHDIGKFYQRSEQGFAEKIEQFSETSKQLISKFRGSNETLDFNHQHLIWTCEFLESVVFKELLQKLPDIKLDYADADNLINLATHHHTPETLLQAIVATSVLWSSGQNNDVEHEEHNPSNEKIIWGSERHKKVPLFSIFNYIKLKNTDSPEAKQYVFGLSPLSLKDEIFPKPIEKIEEGNSQAQYKNLWDKFIAELKFLPAGSVEGFIESLIYLLKKYTWCIPANTTSAYDVSLFEHLKITAAFADCLYVFYTENPENLKFEEGRLIIDENKYPLLLVGGDLSGIQKFIYNIASRKAASSLKGRSFYLQLLVDSIIQSIISHPDIQATIAHVIYSSGGKFYMLLPNVSKVIKALNEIYREIENHLFVEHSGKLMFNLSFVEFTYKGDTIHFKDTNSNDREGQLNDLWKELSDRLAYRKKLNFSSYLASENNFSKLFEPQQVAEKVKICAVTGIELDEKELVKIDERESDEEATYVSKAVKEQVKLGEALKDADLCISVYGKEVASFLENRASHIHKILNIKNYLFDEEQIQKDAFIASDTLCRVKAMNCTDFLSTKIKGQNLGYGFQFYGGNKQALINNRNKTFEELTTIDKNEEDAYLGILRMDVDNLGTIFVKGLPVEKINWTHYSTLSFLLDWFFSGYLNTIRNEFKFDEDGEFYRKGEYKYRDWVNIIYSGGDDVFAVGRWDRIILFAEDIRNEFRKLTGREDISISAGIAVVHNKFPIAKAAEISGVAEEKAKSFKARINGNEVEKNCLNIFDQNICWLDDFEKVRKTKDRMVHLIKNYGMAKSLLQRLMLYKLLKDKNIQREKEGKQPDLTYLWHSAYYLKRFAERYEKLEKKPVHEFVEELLREETFKTKSVDILAVAARWAELELKKFDKKEEK